MRKRYAVSFDLGEAAGDAPALADVSALCVAWALKGCRNVGATSVEIEPATNFPRAEMEGGVWLETKVIKEPEATHWGLRLGHPDSEDANLEWITELCVMDSGDNSRTAFTCVNLVGSRSDVLAPTRRSASRPKIVRDVLKRWGGRQSYPVGVAPLALAPDDASSFVELLLAPKRTRPVVFVSACNETDEPFCKADKLADWVGGLAHIFCAHNRFTSRRLQGLLPARLNCWDGGVRLYWPGMRLSDEWYKHPVWTPQHISDIERRSRNGLPEFVLGVLAAESVYISDPSAPSWASIQRLRQQAMLEEARERGDADELLTVADQIIDDRNRQIIDLQAEREELADRAKKYEAQAKSWQQAYLNRETTDSAKERAAEQPSAPPLGSVADAIIRAREDFKKQLVIALNSKSDGNDSIFESPDELYAALEFLALRYYGTKTSDESIPDLDGALRRATGWHYKGLHGQVAMGKYSNYYTTKMEGRTVSLTHHMGTGSSKDPRHTVRVGFCWDEVSRKVVVGFIGQHQKTDAT